MSFCAADADVGDLLQFQPQALLPLGQGHQPGLNPGLNPGLAGGHLGGHLGGHGLEAVNGGGMGHHVEVKSEGMDAMLEMFLRVRPRP